MGLPSEGDIRPSRAIELSMEMSDPLRGALLRSSGKCNEVAATSPVSARRAGVRARVALRLLRSVLRRVLHRGTLTIRSPDGRVYEFGNGNPAITIGVTDWATIRRLLLNPDLALGEAYMDGTLVVENGDIYELLDLCLRNLGWHGGHWTQRLRAMGRRLARPLVQNNTISVASANAARHYDLGEPLYERFLEPGRQYSCVYCRSPSDTLEEAQEQKKEHLAAKLLLRPGQLVLEIGSGWGGLAVHLAREADVDVTGITLSAEQQRYATDRVIEARLDGCVRFHLRDYREEGAKYDRIVSVGMFEHVGLGNYRAYFDKVRELLTDDGVALIHTIGSASGPGAAHPWIERYIFPGGYAPALSEVVPVIENAGLYITDVEVLRLHYAQTLRAWRQRFMSNRDHLAAVYDERFCRMWEFYLAGCEAGFRCSGLVVFQIQLSKRIDAVPLTREYIFTSRKGSATVPVSAMPQGPGESSALLNEGG
jgi:cyclopropane-fatty-acyl-phospholipid synthase